MDVLKINFSLHIQYADVPEWSNGTGLGPVSLCLRGFESFHPHASERILTPRGFP